MSNSLQRSLSGVTTGDAPLIDPKLRSAAGGEPRDMPSGWWLLPFLLLGIVLWVWLLSFLIGLLR